MNLLMSVTSTASQHSEVLVIQYKKEGREYSQLFAISPFWALFLRELIIFWNKIGDLCKVEEWLPGAILKIMFSGHWLVTLASV